MDAEEDEEVLSAEVHVRVLRDEWREKDPGRIGDAEVDGGFQEL
jgi:hypothetical protein